jgi:hypothetical protein
LEERQWIDWKYMALFLIGEVTCPSETVLCFMSSVSIPVYITHVPFGDPLFLAMSLSCKYFNLNVFALRPSQNVTRVTGKIHEDLWVLYFADHVRVSAVCFDTKLADEMNTSVRQLRGRLCLH